jgi:hypothetical protein
VQHDLGLVETRSWVGSAADPLIIYDIGRVCA